MSHACDDDCGCKCEFCVRSKGDMMADEAKSENSLTFAEAMALDPSEVECRNSATGEWRSLADDIQGCSLAHFRNCEFRRASDALGYLYDTVRAVGWEGWHPDDYDPTDDDLLALIARVKEDTGRAVAEWVGANFGEGVQARFEREFPLPDGPDSAGGEG